MTARLPYQRVLLKISGEILMGEQDFGIERAACETIAAAIKEVSEKGVQLGVVVGGGNIFRGAQAKEFGFSRTPADHIGMLGTAINGIALQQFLAKIECQSHVLSALSFDSFVETYTWMRACHYLEKGSVVIFVGGTGNPYFTTDTAAALRASEMQAQILLKGTKVDGIYDKDPLKHPDAVRFTHLSYADVLSKKLSVMDATAIALCRENHIPIAVFNLFEKGALLKAVLQKEVGSLVMGD